MSSSPRFLSVLLEGETGQGLLSRGFAEIQRRAFERWEKQPWTSAEENWAEAERSLIRPAAGIGAASDGGVRSQFGSHDSSLVSFAPFANEEINEFEVGTEFADVSMSRERSTLSFVKREDSTCEFTETLDETRSSGGSSQVPKLPLSHLRSETKPMLSVREMCETSSGWPSMKLQPQRKPPVWVGQSTGRKEVFSMCTPRPVGASVPSPIPSRSPSRSSSEGSFLDVYENWDRIASIETTASHPEEVVMTFRSEKMSERSNFSLCALYGDGQDAEVRLLRKVISDLDARLQEQEQELQAWRSGQRHTGTMEV